MRRQTGAPVINTLGPLHQLAPCGRRGAFHLVFRAFRELCWADGLQDHGKPGAHLLLKHLQSGCRHRMGPIAVAQDGSPSAHQRLHCPDELPRVPRRDPPPISERVAEGRESLGSEHQLLRDPVLPLPLWRLVRLQPCAAALRSRGSVGQRWRPLRVWVRRGCRCALLAPRAEGRGVRRGWRPAMSWRWLLCLAAGLLRAGGLVLLCPAGLAWAATVSVRIPGVRCFRGRGLGYREIRHRRIACGPYARTNVVRGHAGCACPHWLGRPMCRDHGLGELAAAAEHTTI